MPEKLPKNPPPGNKPIKPVRVKGEVNAFKLVHLVTGADRSKEERRLTIGHVTTTADGTEVEVRCEKTRARLITMLRQAGYELLDEEE
jgi:hypothetical protein